MYKADRRILTPEDNVRLWRYMDLSRFLQLVRSKRLYFSRISELKETDEWEGFPSAAFSSTIRSKFEGMALDGDRVLHVVDVLKSWAVVSCWHQNEYESVAMWKLYTSGRDGVAIRTTVGLLKQSLGDYHSDVLIGAVKYVDHSSDDTSEDIYGLLPLFQKRRSYKHEQEVRAVIPPTKPIPELTEAPPADGMPVPVNISLLIEGIVMSPDYPKWAQSALHCIVEKDGLELRLETSDLLKKPERHC
jgi:hypothetical protein